MLLNVYKLWAYSDSTKAQLLFYHHVTMVATVTAQKVFIYRVILVRIFLHLAQIRKEFGVSLRIQSECGKMRTRITPNTVTFYAMCIN